MSVNEVAIQKSPVVSIDRGEPTQIEIVAKAMGWDLNGGLTPGFYIEIYGRYQPITPMPLASSVLIAMREQERYE